MIVYLNLIENGVPVIYDWYFDWYFDWKIIPVNAWVVMND